MAPLSPVAAKIRAQIARRSKDCPPTDPELHKLRRDLAVERLAEHAQNVVAGWPPPTPDQLARVAAILRTGQTADDRKAAVVAKLAELDGGGDHAA
jgi:hypothetical protein